MTDKSAPVEDTTPQWVLDLQLKFHEMPTEELMRFSVIAEINDMQYQQDEPEQAPPEFWADVWWRTFELWCERRGLPMPKKTELWDGMKTNVYMPESRILH